MRIFKIISTLLLEISSQKENTHLWPYPKYLTTGTKSITLSPDFEFITNNKNSRIQRVFRRYKKLISKEKFNHIVPTFISITNGDLKLNKINVYIREKSEELNLNTDESYRLIVHINRSNKVVARIESNNIYGAMRGLETFSQLITYESKTLKIHNLPITIKDKPRFKHRGILLDTSRNFYSIDSIESTINAMSFNKLNVLHWHMLDATSFPFKSQKHPELWKEGTFSEKETYSFEQINKLIEYGLDRGVRIIPEIEAPAHSYIIGKAHPELALCMDELDWGKYSAEPPSGQLDPTNPKSLELVNDLIDEFSTVFKDNFIHLSGDEVNLQCWKESEKIQKYLEKNCKNLEDLLRDFALKMQKNTIKNKKQIIVWQEILLNHNITLPKDSLVQVWLGAEDTKKVIERKHKVIASSYQFWYLDCGHGQWRGNAIDGKDWCEYKSWQKVYSYNLLENLSSKQSELVEGGEVAIWSEHIDPLVLDFYLWPRASAAAEVLWSGNQKYDITKVLSRINNWRFRLLKRGVKAEPLQPEWCVRNPGRCNEFKG